MLGMLRVERRSKLSRLAALSQECLKCRDDQVGVIDGNRVLSKYLNWLLGGFVQDAAWHVVLAQSRSNLCGVRLLHQYRGDTINYPQPLERF